MVIGLVVHDGVTVDSFRLLGTHEGCTVVGVVNPCFDLGAGVFFFGGLLFCGHAVVVVSFAPYVASIGAAVVSVFVYG